MLPRLLGLLRRRNRFPNSLCREGDFVDRLDIDMGWASRSLLYLVLCADVPASHQIARERAAAIAEEENYRDVFIGVLTEIMVRTVREAGVHIAEEKAK